MAWKTISRKRPDAPVAHFHLDIFPSAKERCEFGIFHEYYDGDWYCVNLYFIQFSWLR